MSRYLGVGFAVLVCFTAQACGQKQAAKAPSAQAPTQQAMGAPSQQLIQAAPAPAQQQAPQSPAATGFGGITMSPTQSSPQVAQMPGEVDPGFNQVPGQPGTLGAPPAPAANPQTMYQGFNDAESAPPPGMAGASALQNGQQSGFGSGSVAPGAPAMGTAFSSMACNSTR